MQLSVHLQLPDQVQAFLRRPCSLTARTSSATALAFADGSGRFLRAFDLGWRGWSD